jgi:hypothetical protein
MPDYVKPITLTGGTPVEIVSQVCSIPLGVHSILDLWK